MNKKTIKIVKNGRKEDDGAAAGRVVESLVDQPASNSAAPMRYSACRWHRLIAPGRGALHPVSVVAESRGRCQPADGHRSRAGGGAGIVVQYGGGRLGG